MKTEHSLHEDFGLHKFRKIVAELADGRHAAIEIGEDGHVEIIAVWEPEAGGGHPEPTYPQKQVMESAQGEEEVKNRPGFTPRPDGPKESEAEQRLQEMLDDALAKKPKKAQHPKEQEIPQSVTQIVAPAPTSTTIDPSKYNQPNPYQYVQAQPSVGMSAQMMQMVNAIHAQQTANMGVGVGGGDGKREKSAYHKVYATKLARDPVFQARLGSIMNDNQFDRRLRGRTRGKLDMTRLYKAETGSTSVFTQKMMRKNKRYNIALVIDQSGSMGSIDFEWSPLTIAADCAQFLAQHFNRIPGVELMIVGFSSSYVVHKRFNEKIDLDQVKSKIGHWKSGGGGTTDVPALETAYDALAKQDKGNNIVLLLTDGDSNDPEQSMKLMRKHEKTVTTIGVGILQEAKRVPGQRILVNNISDLKPQIIKVLEREIRRG